MTSSSCNLNGKLISVKSSIRIGLGINIVPNSGESARSFFAVILVLLGSHNNTDRFSFLLLHIIIIDPLPAASFNIIYFEWILSLHSNSLFAPLGLFFLFFRDIFVRFCNMPLYFSHSKKVALALLPKISGSFSFIGSSWIIIEVLTSINKRSTVYNRLLLLMSTIDAIVSISYIASTWPIPSITPTGMKSTSIPLST